MTRLIPINHKNDLTPIGSGFGVWPNLLDHFFSQPLASNRQFINATFKVDIEETEAAYLIVAEMPGIQKDEITLNVDKNDNLLISISQPEKEINNEKNYIHKERGIRAMTRRIGLVGAKLDHITAKLEDGILFITVPKDEQVSNRRQIAIE